MNLEILEREGKRYHLLIAFIAIAVTVLIAYSNTFKVPFVFDDAHNILNNPHLRLKSISYASFKEAAVESPSRFRALPNISFALNHYFNGLDVFGYHLVNVVLHIAAALVFYFLALSTLNLPRNEGRYRYGHEMALIASLLWALHPVQTNAVTYIVQRMTCMATLFSLSSMLLYVRARLCTDSLNRRIVLFSASLICFGAAFFSKENSAILPLVIIAYELFFFRDVDFRRDWRRISLLTALAGIFLVLVGWLFIGKLNVFDGLLAGYASRKFTMAERLLTESRVVFYYLGLIALPLPSKQQFDYDFLLSKSIIDPPQTVVALLALAVVPFLIVAFYRRGNRLAGFAIFWYFATLVIESSIVPLELVYEHRLYMPSTFPILAAVVGVYYLAKNRVNAARGGLLAVAVIFIILTWQRNVIWASPYDLWKDAVTKSPGRARAHVNLALAIKEKGDYVAAMSHLQKAIELEIDYGMAYLNLGLLYKDVNLLPQAIATLKKGLNQKRINQADIYYALGLVYGQSGDYQNAVYNAKMALAVDPDMLKPYIVLGVAYDEMGDLNTAYGNFEKGYRLGLDENNLFFNWAVTCLKMGRKGEALGRIAQGLALYPDDNKLLSLRSRIATYN